MTRWEVCELEMEGLRKSRMFIQNYACLLFMRPVLREFNALRKSSVCVLRC
jgi:hypothetical protein